jgi:hypothetical protein
MISTASKKIFTRRSARNLPIPATNYFHLYWDVVWFGVLYGSTISFLAVFATRMGAAKLKSEWDLQFRVNEKVD